ncbi:MAG: hypothetical protein JW955_16965 [Sedimentisphaerales bacterium]|nr:hypothetical protein [Sedimentisphaerales bacterium]
MKAQTSKTKRKAKPADSGIATILANSTRLELVIVAAVLLVLMLSNRAPRSGNAEVRGDGAQIPASAGRSTPIDQADMGISMQGVDATPLADQMLPVETQPPTKRIAIVDARNTGNPKYKDLMYGEITVRWVWNGGKFVPQKVCVVDEGNGASSVWSFDQQNGVTVTEKQGATDTPQ